MGTVPLNKSLHDYFRALAGVQRYAKLWAQGGENWSFVLPALQKVLADGRAFAPTLAAAVVDACPNARVGAYGAKLVADALTETETALATAQTGGSMGKAMGLWAELGEFAANSRFLQRLGQIVLAGIGFTVAVKGVQWTWRQVNDPFGIIAKTELLDHDQATCARWMSEAGSDPLKKRLAIASCARLHIDVSRALDAMDDTNGGWDDSCGLLDTPFALGMGLLVGGALSWRFIGDVMD